MVEKTKTHEELAAEKRQKANALRNAIEHFTLKLRTVDVATTIEEQIKILVKYNDYPSKDEILSGKKDFESYQKIFLEKQYEQYFAKFPEMLDTLGNKRGDNNTANFFALCLTAFLFKSNNEEFMKKQHEENVEAYIMMFYPNTNNSS